MAEPTYRIKLYGHTSADVAAFSKNVAMILGIDADAARSLLADVPVVVREGMERERAAALVEALTLVKALAIMEPEGAADSAPSAEAISASDPGAAGLTWEDLEEESPWRPWVRPIIAVAAGLALLIGLTMVLRPAYRETTVEPARQTSRPAPAPASSPAQEREEYYQSLSVEQLEAEGERLYFENEELKQRLKFAQDDVERLYNTYGADEQELSRSRLQAKRVRTELRRNDRELRLILFRIRALERAAARARHRSGPPPGPGPEEAPTSEE